MTERTVSPSIEIRASASASSLHQAIIEAHELSFVIVFEDQLARAYFCLLVKDNFRAQMPLQVFQGCLDVCVFVDFRGGALASGATGSQALDLAHSEAATGCALRITHAKLRIHDSQQSPAMPRAKFAFLNPFLNR